ncbi:hypothetical protein [Gemmata sp.]|uniref:hypothetical protein n=1 Tax=Gemmata sp. TaxID=1914242 RepID=UPI003F6FBB36
MPPTKRKSTGPAIDRFATHKHLINQIPTIKAAVGSRGGYAACAAAFLLWDWADARTGQVRYVTVTRLAKALAANRTTARDCLKVLESCEVIYPGPRKGTWLMNHVIKPEPEIAGD